MSPPEAPARIEFEPELGVVRLTRAHLARLMAADGATTGTEMDELRAVGALGDDGPHPGLAPCLAVLRRARARFFLRTWRRGRRRVVEGVIGPAGIVVIPGGADPHAVQDLRFHPRPGALARVLAGLLGVAPAAADEPVLPTHVLTWDDVRALASHPPPWAAERLGPGADVAVHDLSWQPWPDGPKGSVLALVDLGAAGMAEVVPVDRDDAAAGYRLNPRRPEEVWFGLCRLAAAPAAAQR